MRPDEIARTPTACGRLAIVVVVREPNRDGTPAEPVTSGDITRLLDHLVVAHDGHPRRVGLLAHAMHQRIDAILGIGLGHFGAEDEYRQIWLDAALVDRTGTCSTETSSTDPISAISRSSRPSWGSPTTSSSTTRPPPTSRISIEHIAGPRILLATSPSARAIGEPNPNHDVLHEGDRTDVM